MNYFIIIIRKLLHNWTLSTGGRLKLVRVAGGYGSILDISFKVNSMNNNLVASSNMDICGEPFKISHYNILPPISVKNW